MSSIVEPPLKARAGRRQGLRISPELIGKAKDDTAAQVTRIGLTFLGTTAFCLLSLLSPGSSLLGASEKISVPLAGPVSFFGFTLLGPAVLIVIRVYLQIYAEHSERLDGLARSMQALRAPNLEPLQNPLIRYSSGSIFYLLLPVAMMLLVWKAAVFPAWGLGLLCVALGVIVTHVMLWLNRFRRLWPLPLKVLTSVWAMFVVLSVVFGVGAQRNARWLITDERFGVRRPFELSHTNLSGQWLIRSDLRRADLLLANLSGTNLSLADLSGAYLYLADLSHANLGGANLSAADLNQAKLGAADLSEAHLSHADLSHADLSHARLGAADLRHANLYHANLSDADLSGTSLGTVGPASLQVVALPKI